MPDPAPPKVGEPINVLAVKGYLEKEGPNLIRQAKVNTNLALQTCSNSCRLKLAPSTSAVLPPPDLAKKIEMSVGILGRFVIQGNTVTLQDFASGFFLTESGAFAIAQHSLENTKSAGYVVMTRDGRLFPVQSVLAASPKDDLAIVQVEGEGFAPLPVASTAPVGSTVWVLSHPVGRFYSLTTGIASGYVNWITLHGDGQTTWMSITADFAIGSSGAPVVNETGAVVGLASKTETIYANYSARENPQMVMKLCVPAKAILDLIQRD